ncbi:MAG: phage portal protein [Rickettsiales bacterium]|nr:phage portal protein [Rickettsiales bacterium]|tara:strand:+ start:8289 stop:9866 length:1578 start_codon:yes stop_codon:yes gene_type:complete
MVNILDKAIEAVSPEAAVRRQTARKVLEVQRAYEAAQPSRLRKRKTDAGSGDAIIERAGESLRLQARHLDENHDLAGGVLDCLVNNVVGRGITVEPQVKLKNGELAKPINDQLLELWEEWIRYPEVTWECHWNHLLRIVARHWFRDGEVLLKHVEGLSRTVDHGTIVPYSLELIEADFLPFELNDQKKGIIHGVEKNAWRKPRAYYLYKEHPGNPHTLVLRQDTKRIDADKVMHLKITKRISQTRGVSVFANVLTRLEDIKDYEVSERLAAKVAASICAYIRKSLDGPTSGVQVDDTGNRLMKMQPGMIFDNLLPGEEVGMIDSNRPNTMLEQFRNSQMRAIAAGTSTSFSSISKDYNGTYSAQRQELVEQSVHYAVLREYFIERCVRPVWERFVDMAILSGQLELPKTKLNPRTLKKAGFQGPVMPWIDPQKEVTAEEKAVAAGFKSRAQVIRERGGNPQDTFEQIKLEREEEDDAGIIFSTNVNSKTTNETKGDSDASESKEGSEAGNGNAQPDESGDTDTDD